MRKKFILLLLLILPASPSWANPSDQDPEVGGFSLVADIMWIAPNKEKIIIAEEVMLLTCPDLSSKVKNSIPLYQLRPWQTVKAQGYYNNKGESCVKNIEIIDNSPQKSKKRTSHIHKDSSGTWIN